MFGVPWTIEVNPNALYPYAKEGYAKDSLGSCISTYIDNAIGQIKYFGTSYGDESVAEINDVASAHVLTIDVDEDKKFSYCGVVVSADGKLTIMINENYMGTNTNDALERSVLMAALNTAPASAVAAAKPLSFAARVGIRQEYDAAVAKTQKKLAEQLEKEDVKLVPNFEAAFAALAAEGAKKKSQLRDDWQANLGNFTARYFDAVAGQMAYQKFDEDELLREGFNEAVEKGEIAFRVVDKLKYDSYCEVVVEDGVLFVQVSFVRCSPGPSRWRRTRKVGGLQVVSVY